MNPDDPDPFLTYEKKAKYVIRLFWGLKTKINFVVPHKDKKCH